MLFFPWSLPTETQCVKRHLEHYPALLRFLRATDESPASLCGQGQPSRTNGGQLTLSCSMATGCIWPQVINNANLLPLGR